jgi:bifunctional non-homologous end joining protein LigD
MSLKKYHSKRHFKHTPEPSGKKSASSKNIFVIQKHAASHLHYDFRLAIHGVLKSWAVPKGPCLDPTVKRLAVEVEDHPLAYANFEGTIPKGQYGGGEVIVWDKGHWQSDEDLEKAYQHGSMHFILNGEKLHGEWKLIRMKTEATNPQWLLIKGEDKYSKKLSDYDITREKPQSVISKKKINEISKKKISPQIKKFPANFKPELAYLSKSLPTNNEWIYEEKYDGYRILSFINDKQIRLISRNGHDWTKKFPTIVSELKKIKIQSAILDGEIVVLDKQKKSNFQLLQNAFKEENDKKCQYFIFDLPFYQGKDLSPLSLIERKELLKKIILKKKTRLIHFSPYYTKNATQFFDKCCKSGREGIIAKHKDSSYRQKRTHEWLKIKCHQGQEFVVVGFTDPEGKRKYFGSLLLGYYDHNKKLVYCGHVGTGFNHDSLQELHEKLSKLHQPRPSLSLPKQGKSLRKSHWVKPIMVVEIKFTGWTNDGLLRHPSYQGLRKDKKSTEVRREIPTKKILIKKTDSQPKKSIIKQLTHPDKILFPNAEISKYALAEYYVKVEKNLLAHIKSRLLTLLRCPDPNKKKCFFQKNWMAGMPEGINKVKINIKSKMVEYINIKTKTGLVSAAQLSILELHPWSSKLKKIDFPDQIIFDLDPDISISWEKLVKAALLVRDTLSNLELKSYVKLTGGKGLHIVVPITANKHFDAVKEFARLVAEKLATHFPHLFTAHMSKKERIGKIFIDYLRNEEGATAIAPFSPRANEAATIAVPIAWEKLKSIGSSQAYSIKTIDKYFRDYPQNPWKDFFTVDQSILISHIKALKKI